MNLAAFFLMASATVLGLLGAVHLLYDKSAIELVVGARFESESNEIKYLRH